MLTKEQTGIPDYAKALQAGMQTAADVYKPQTMQAQLLQRMLQNKIDSPKAQDAEGWYQAQKQGLLGENGLRSLQMQKLMRQEEMAKQNPFLDSPGDIGKIGALLYMQQHPELMNNQGGNEADYNQPSFAPNHQARLAKNPDNVLPMDLNTPVSWEQFKNGESYLPSLESGATLESKQPQQQGNVPKKVNYADLARQSLIRDLSPKQIPLVGPAAEAEGLNQLKQKYGEDSEVYKNAQALAALKQHERESLTSQRQRRAEGLKPGENWVKDKYGENIGINRDYSPTERKEEKGRLFFNEVYPEILKATSYYSGQGSIERFTKDALNYKNDKKAQQRIDNFRAAIKLVPAGLVKENATLGGANTNQVYNRLVSSINSSDLPKKVDEIVKKYGLPKEAELRAGQRFQSILNKATQSSKNIAARHTEYLGGDKKGHFYNPKTKSLEEFIVGPQDWESFTAAGGY